MSALADAEKLEGQAIRALAETARAFARLTPRKNPTGPYARALNELLTAARLYSVRSDEAWAAEVAELKDRLAALEAQHQNISGWPADLNTTITEQVRATAWDEPGRKP